MDTQDDSEDDINEIKSFSDSERQRPTKHYSSYSFSEQEQRSSTSRIVRSRSLCEFELNEYTMGDIRRLHERLAARCPGAFRSPGPSLRDFNRSQILSLFCLCFVNFISFCSMSILAPFFPKEAEEKGMGPSSAGIVFSFYAFIIFVSSPIIGKIIPFAGARFIFTSGLFVAGGCNLLFGLLEYIYDPSLFAIYCFLVRGLEALGAAAYSTATFVFVVEVFPANVGAVLGLMETFVGLGMSIGPGIGGLLYSVGGFGLPFFALGIVLMLTVPISLCLLPTIHYSERSRKSHSMLSLLKSPAVLLIGSVIVVISIVWSFLDPTLEPHLRQFALTPEKIGLVFLLFSGVYGVSSPFWGWLSDRCRGPWLMMSLGLLSSSASLLLLGPATFLHDLPSAPWLNILALCLLGASVALGLLPTFQAILDAAVSNGCKDELSTYSLIAGTWSSMYALGEVIGPLAGGVITETYDFATCCTWVAILCLVLAVITAVYFLTNPYKLKHCSSRGYSSDSGYSRSSDDDSPVETRPILKSGSTEWF